MLNENECNKDAKITIKSFRAKRSFARFKLVTSCPAVCGLKSAKQ